MSVPLVEEKGAGPRRVHEAVACVALVVGVEADASVLELLVAPLNPGSDLGTVSFTDSRENPCGQLIALWGTMFSNSAEWEEPSSCFRYRDRSILGQPVVLNQHGWACSRIRCWVAAFLHPGQSVKLTPGRLNFSRG